MYIICFLTKGITLTKNNLIKCNPAIKSQSDKEALRKALVDGYFDVVATDHAPHTWEEKQQAYISAPSGLPLIQTSLNMMMSFVQEGWITKEWSLKRCVTIRQFYSI